MANEHKCKFFDERFNCKTFIDCTKGKVWMEGNRFIEVKDRCWAICEQCRTSLGMELLNHSPQFIHDYPKDKFKLEDEVFEGGA